MNSAGNTAWSISKISLVLFIKSAPLIKAFKLFKIAKPLLTFGTMALSAVAYAFWLGPWFAIGLTLMLFIHEMGHVIALRMRGFPASSPVFIPFLGAAIFAPKFHSRDDEAFVGIGGPVLGSAAAILLFGVYFLLDPQTTAAHLVLIVSFSAMFLNLFNMIPVQPMDGGRITQAVGGWIEYAGLGGLLLLSISMAEPSILLIWILVLFDLTFLGAELRKYAIMLCWAAMTGLMILGFGHQPWFVSSIDMAVGGLFIGLTFSKPFAKLAEAEHRERERRPRLSTQRRTFWSVAYVGLGTILIGLVALQSAHMPERARANKEQQLTSGK